MSASSTRSHSYSSLYRIPACGCATGLCARCVFQGPRNPVQNPCTQDFYRIHASTLGPYGSFTGSMSWDPLQEPSTRSMPVDPLQGTRVHVSGTFTRTMSLVSVHVCRFFAQDPCSVCRDSLPDPCRSQTRRLSMRVDPLEVSGSMSQTIQDPCLRLQFKIHACGSAAKFLSQDPLQDKCIKGLVHDP